MTKEIVAKIQTVCLTIFVQGCWAGDSEINPGDASAPEGRRSIIHLNNISGKYRCKISSQENTDSKVNEQLNIKIELVDGAIKDFSSSWVIASDSLDLRGGYTSTCNVGIEKFQQIKESDGLLLKYMAGAHEPDHANCQIRISSPGSSLLNAESYECNYPCLKFNVSIDTESRLCRNIN
jgi:hypothetical protein